MMRFRARAVRLARPPLYAALLAMGALSGCQVLGGAEHAAEIKAGAGWRIIERVGEARVLTPRTGTWEPAVAGQSVEEGAEIRTGAGGRVIVARPGAQVVAGPASALVLDRGTLRQDAGEARYRLETPYALLTPHLRARTGDAAVLDLSVRADATTLEVEEGQLELLHGDAASVLKAGSVARLEPDGMARLLAGQDNRGGAQAPAATQPPAPATVAAVPPPEVTGTDRVHPWQAPERAPAAVAAGRTADPLGPASQGGPHRLMPAAPALASNAAEEPARSAPVVPAGYTDAAARTRLGPPAATASAAGPPARFERVIVPGRAEAGSGTASPAGKGGYDRLVGGLLDGVARVRLVQPDR